MRMNQISRAIITEAEEKNLTILFEKVNEVPPALADNARIREVIDNLLTNAVKYTAEGFIKATIEASLTEVTVCVVDSGVGIKPEDQIDLLKKFKRVDN